MGTGAVRTNSHLRRMCVLLWTFSAGALFFGTGTRAASQSTTPAKTGSSVGTIKSIDGTTITLTTDAGTEVKVNVPADAKLVRVPPGSKDLKEAAPMVFADLQTGDRVLVRTKPGDDAAVLVAASVIAMKKADIAEKQTHEREEWQRHGIGGLVKNVDAGAGTVTIGTVTAAGNKDVTVQVGKTTVLRRYAPDSIKFDDAKPSTLAEINAGDQLRARGTHSPDGASFSADEIVTGAFRNISGMITAVNTSSGTITLNDLATKKPVEVKITPDSQLRKLPQPMAQRIAVRLKGGAADGVAGNAAAGGGTNSGAAQSGNQPQATPQGGGNASNGGTASGGGMGGGRGGGGGGGDLQQLLSRLPANTLTDFQKGDAVMIVATTGQRETQATAITLLGGVEPILQASPQGASILTPWSLSGGGGDTGTP